jgi:hypothetical protein
VIINIRGTSGSGKSTIAFTLLDKFPFEKIKDKNDKIMGYKVEAGLSKPIYIVGKYETKCGGCDTIPTQQEAADRAVYFHELGGHVLMEGLLQSAAGPKGAVTATISATNVACFVILDTPVEVCLDRVRARRLARGDERPLNEKNTRDKWDQTMSTAKTMKKLGYDVRSIDHTRAFEDVMNILRELK